VSSVQWLVSRSQIQSDALKLATGHLSLATFRLQLGGAGRDRTGDLLNANQALSQLSYSPSRKRLRRLLSGQWPVVSGQFESVCEDTSQLATGH
jgi:hypothetical protein